MNQNKNMKKEKYREEGVELEKQEKYEEAYLKYEEAAKMGDALSMTFIARMYLFGKLRPVETSNLAQLLQQGGPIFLWSLQSEMRPDYKSGLEWMIKAADLGEGLACAIAGNMLCTGLGCETDMEKGIEYLEKAAANGEALAKNWLCLYRPDGRRLTDEAYEDCLADFVSAVEGEDDRAYELYATLKSGTEKQLARLGHILIAAQNVQRKGYEQFPIPTAPSGIPLLPAAAKRGAWRTFLRFNLDAWAEKQPLIAVSADILNAGSPWLLDNFHHARIVGTAIYKSPAFGWLEEKKEAVLIRLGVADTLDVNAMNEVVKSFILSDEEYVGDSAAFFAENGEKEYSFEIAGIQGSRVEVLWRYTIGGSDRVKRYFEPTLISMDEKENYE